MFRRVWCRCGCCRQSRRTGTLKKKVEGFAFPSRLAAPTRIGAPERNAIRSLVKEVETVAGTRTIWNFSLRSLAAKAMSFLRRRDLPWRNSRLSNRIASARYRLCHMTSWLTGLVIREIRTPG